VLRSFEIVAACVVAIICGPIQLGFIFNLLHMFGCFAALIELMSAPEVVPAYRVKLN
jgi:hypothetical protein